MGYSLRLVLSKIIVSQDASNHCGSRPRLDEASRTRTISKQIRGGCAVDVEDGRNMLADAASSSFSAAFTGEEEDEEVLQF